MNNKMKINYKKMMIIKIIKIFIHKKIQIQKEMNKNIENI
jgi:hypothetical protein